MVNYENIKKIAIKSVLLEKMEENEKNTITQVISTSLLIKTLEALLSNNSLQNDDIKTTSDKYAKTFINIAKGLEGKFVSYKAIAQLIKERDLWNLLALKLKDVTDINNLYQNKTEIKRFDSRKFSPSMYNLFSITENEYSRLSKIHFNVIVPFMQSMITKYRCDNEDIVLDDCGSNVGTEIKIAIKSIPSPQILSEIISDYSGIKKYIYKSFTTSDGYVKIILY